MCHLVWRISVFPKKTIRSTPGRFKNLNKIKSFLGLGIRKIIRWLPRSIRKRVINEFIEVERTKSYLKAIEWLLQIYDDVGYEIDQACFRWGDGVHIKHKLMDGIHSFFYERICENSKILDLGCGKGVVANAMAQHANADVVGIDMDAGAISFAQERYQHPKLRFMVGNVFTDLPVGESFDVIVLSSVLEHLENRPKFLQGITNNFRPKKFLIRVPTFEQHYFKALKRELRLFAFVDQGHVLEYSLETFKAEMAQANLRIDHLEIRWGDIWAECTPETE